METLTRLVAESLARHGFDRPVDYRRLQWSRWFRCESHHSLLIVPSKPGVFAFAEEITHLGADLSVLPATQSEAKESAAFPEAGNSKPEPQLRRMLAVTQFFDDDDMAFVLDRMLSHENPMRARLASGRYFVRFVVIEDAAQRRSICNALKQWIVSSAEKATGIGSHFATSLELAPVEEPPHGATTASAVPRSRSEAQGSDTADGSSPNPSDERRINTAPRLNSAIATNIHCSSSFPSGF